MKDWHVLVLLGLLALVLLSRKQVGASNEETWQWTDYRGHRYCISVNRQVH